MAFTLEKPSYVISSPLVSSTFDLLASYLSSEHRSCAVTAGTLTTIYTLCVTDVDSVYNVGYLWGTLFHVIKQFPSTSPEHTYLLKLLLDLRSQPPPEGPGRVEWEENDPCDLFWTDLPYWRAIWTGYLYEAPLHPPISERPGGDIAFHHTATSPGPWCGIALSVAEWTSLNAFLAKLHATTDVYYLDLFGLYTLLDALEEPHVDPKAFDDLVPVAAVWVLYAGEKIRGNDVGYPQVDRDDGSKRFPWSVGALWDGQKGFSDLRWKFWRSRFGAVSERDDVEPVTRDWARRAERRMEEIDTD